MIFCITARGEGLDAEVDSSFGRCRYFLFFNDETNELRAVENVPGAHGAGVQAAQTVAENGAGVLITGSVGPNAHQGLAAAGVEIYTGARGTVRDALEDYRAGKLTRSAGATGKSHGGKAL